MGTGAWVLVATVEGAVVAAPTSLDWTLLFLYVGTALTVSFCCSVLEATLLSVRMASLLERADQGERGAAILLDLKRTRVDDAISAILLLNTVAHTVGAALAGAQAAVCFGSRWVGVFSGVLTVLVLVVTEIIPKTLGTVHAKALTGVVGRSLWVMVRVLAPVLRITRAVTQLIAKGHRHTVSRAELAALVAMATRDGSLRRDESRVLRNVLRFDHARVEDVMTPRTVATMLPASTPMEVLLGDEVAHVYSRIPLYEGDRDHVTGYVLQREVLGAVARGADRAAPLREYKRDVPLVPESATLGETLKLLLERREHMAIALDEFGGVSGLVTLEDVIETILGVEIVDESDRVEDLRKLAVQLRDRRLERIAARSAPAREAAGAQMRRRRGGEEGKEGEEGEEEREEDKRGRAGAGTGQEQQEEGEGEGAGAGTGAEPDGKETERKAADGEAA